MHNTRLGLHMLNKILAAASIATVLASPVRGMETPETVQEFLYTCSFAATVADLSDPYATSSDALQAGVCLGLVIGISSFAQLNCDLHTVGEMPFFLKADTRGVTYLDQWIEMLSADENMNNEVSVLAIELSERWPCGN